MQTALEGLTLHVENVDRSRDWYLRIPGATVIYQRPGEYALLQIGPSRLGLLARRMLPEPAPRFHLEVSTSTADIDALYEEVTRAGIQPNYAPRDRAWDERSFQATDPDGNAVEFDSRLDPT